ncbi:MAG: glycyl-radical enzyme activating protein [Bacillota bacterium]
MEGLIFDIDHFAAHDGPGIRMTVYLKGCPLRCIWCHSPESQKKDPTILFIKDECVLCGKCVSACNRGFQQISQKNKRIYKRQACIHCGDCVNVCPAEALKISGEKKTVLEVVNEVKENIIFYKNSGGGVTLTGGEVLYQPEFTLELLKNIKEEGIHTIIETSGMGEDKDLIKLIPYVDFFYYDLKLIDSEKHKQFTGTDNKIILDNLKILKEKTDDIVVRIPLIPGYTDHISNIRKIYKKMFQLDLKEVHLLPYNTSASAKYEWLDREYIPGEMEAQSDEYLKKLKNIAPESINVKIIN